jgi:hypothetical protein
VRTFTVVASRQDRTAALVAAALRDCHGPAAAIRWLDAGALALAIGWSHRVGRTGEATTDLRLPTGEQLDAGALGVVLNRAAPPAPPAFSGPDREYAATELFALLLSWLASVPGPVVNPPSPRGLAGAGRGRLEWLGLAAAAGIPIRACRMTTSARRYRVTGHHPDGVPTPIPTGDRPAVLAARAITERRRGVVAGGTVEDVPDTGMHRPLTALAAAVGCPLLGVDVVRVAGGGRWLLDRVDVWPEARTHAGATALATALSDCA